MIVLNISIQTEEKNNMNGHFWLNYLPHAILANKKNCYSTYKDIN